MAAQESIAIAQIEPFTRPIIWPCTIDSASRARRTSEAASPWCGPPEVARSATGRKSVYIASHASTIIGWPTPDARLFLMDLREHATQRENTYRHSWRVGDLVIWDNRATMHRARAFDDGTHVRELRRVTTLDVEAPA